MFLWMSKSSSHLQSRDLSLLYRCIPRSWKKGLLTKSSQNDLGTSLQDPIPNYSQAVRLEEGYLEDSPMTEEPLLDSLFTSIKTLSSQGHLSNAFKTFSLLQHRLSTTTHILYPISSLLLCCTSLKALLQGKQLHAYIISLGFGQDPLLISKLVTLYASFDLLTDAHFIVEDSYARHAVPWNVLISAYVREGFCNEALSAYKQMVKREVKPDNYTFPSVLKACGEEFDLDFGRAIHKTIETSGLEWNLFVHNSLVSMYAKSGSVVEARSLFDRMPERDAVSWNAMISGYATKGMWKEANDLFEMIRMDNSKVNSATWCIIAGGNLKTGDYMGALKLISQMRRRSVCLDTAALVTGLSACSHVGFIKFGKEIHGSMIRMFYDGNESVRNVLITMYSRCKDLKHAFILFRLAETKNVITWNCMIAGFAHLDQYDEASFLFRELFLSGVEPNYVTIASVLPLCARIANLQHGKELHCYVIKQRFEQYLLIWNSLVDMYSKSGRVSDAQVVFNSMRQRDEVSYTSLISGYGMQGEGQAALKLFDDMNRRGIKPDHIAMVSVLSACSHSGLVAHGEMLFKKMVSTYGLNPKMEHFACMVDLFGRAGLLSKAEKIIKMMSCWRIRPSPAMWATLIGACRKYGNMEFGERAAEKLLDMRPENPGYYVLIANMYAAVGHWTKLSEVRTLMRDLGLRKDPGCSWVDVGDGFHSFLVGDRSCPQAREVYLLLYGLALQMGEASCTAAEDLGLEDDTE